MALGLEPSLSVPFDKEPARVTDGHPLTPTQQGMLFHRLSAPGAGTNMVQVVCRTGEPVQRALFLQALSRTAARHAALRTRFVWRDMLAPAAEVLEHVEPELSESDLSALDALAEETELAALLASDRRRDFELERAPCWRVNLLRLREDSCAVVFTCHHILLDRQSLAWVLGDLWAAYDGLVEARPEQPHEPPVSFARFVAAIPSTLDDGARAYFCGLLGDVDTRTPVDVGFVARLGRDDTTRSVRGSLRRSSTQALVARALELGVPESTLFDAAWGMVLQCYSDRRDVLFGSARSGRAHSHAGRGPVGMLISTLPRRVCTDDTACLSDLVAHVRAQELEQAAYEGLGLRDIQSCSQVPQGAPLFESITSFETESLAHALTVSEGAAQRALVYLWQTGFALTLVGQLDDELRVELGFDPARLDVESARRLLAHMLRALELVATEPVFRKLHELSLLSAQERRQLLVDWNQTDADYPRTLRLQDLFEAQVEQGPARVAVISGGQTLSYRALDERANQLAHLLRARGVARGDRVGICLPRSLDMITSLFAVLKAGAAYVPLDPAYPVDRLRFMLGDSGARLVLTIDSLRAKVPSDLAAQLVIDREAANLAAQSVLAPPCETNSEDVAYIIYTSGSTGKPKGVVVRHRPVLNLIDWVNRTFQVGVHDRLLFVTSICFDLSVYDVFGTLASGASLHVASGDELCEPRALVRLLEGGTITFWDSAPAALGQLVPLLGRSKSRSNLRLVFLSGDWIPVPLPDQVRAAFPAAQVVSLGGATEATVWSNFYRVERVPAHWPSIPYGRPIQNARYYVLSDSLQPMPIGAPGQLHIGGACLAVGYHGQNELTDEKFIADPFVEDAQGKLYRTGDLARLMPDGNIEFLGRMDQQVKVRGFRIELGEVEAVLNQHPLVSSALVDAPLLAGQERVLVAYVVAPANTQIAALRALCQQSLPEHMVPAHIVLLDALPMTQNGKVDRQALPLPSAAASSAYVAPRSALESVVAEVIGQCLGVTRVGVHDNFFELGGHSLLAVRVISELSRVFEYEVALSAFLRDPTVEAISRLVSERPATRSRVLDAIVPDATAAPVVSLEQSRLAFVQGMRPDSATYNISVGFRLTDLRRAGSLRVDLLARALEAVVLRHEPLRTGFFLSPEGYVAQIVADARPELRSIDLCELEGSAQQAALAAEMRALNGLAFDLSKPPLLRALLVKLAEHEHVLVVVVHHVVFDGPSTPILLRELIAHYDAFVADSVAELPELPIRFNDAARWQLGRLELNDYGRELEYWKKRLLGPLPVLQLPHDRPRPRVFSHLGGVLSFQLSGRESAALRRVAQGQRSSVFTLLLAAFHTLLHRYSGQSDLLVAIPVAAREQPETRDLIGLLLNTLVIRSEFAPGMTFQDVLAQVRTRFLEALDHRELPFEQLVAELNPARDPSVTPVFQAFFSYEETSERVSQSEHFDVSSVVVDQTFAGTDLSLFVEDSSERGLHGYFEYSSDLFDVSTVAQIAEGFVALLGHIAEAPETPVERLRAMSSEARERQLRAWNDTRADFNLERTVVDLFEHTAAVDPSRPAVIGREVTLSYGELSREVRRLSSLLSAAGAGPDVGVAVFLERGPRLVSSLLAVLRAGSYYIPLDPGHPAERNQRIIATARPKLVLAEARTLANLPALGGSALLNLDELPVDRVDDASCAPTCARSTDAAYVIFTSGSTGDPKGVSVPHRALTNFLLSMAIAPGLSSRDVLLSLTTISFDIAGLELYLPLVTGACVEVGGRELALDPKALSARLCERGVSMFQATPATFRMLIEDGWTGQPGLKVLCGGEAFPPDLAESLFPRVGSVWNMYGPTETTIWSSLQKLAPGEVISIGHPIHNTQLYVLNDALEPVPHGAAGMLWIGGDGVATGYFQRPDLTDAAFVKDPFSSAPGARIYKTGDLARRLKDGRLECLGRTDFQVKIRGYRIELGEIESAIRTYPGVLQTVVHVKPSAAGEKQLVGYVVLSDRGTEVPQGLVEHLRAKLPHYMVPGAFVALEALPLTPNGKVDRKALPDPSANLKPVAMTGAPPRDDIEVKIADIFRSYLSLDAVDSEASFFDLGGHSLMAARVTRELNATFDLELSVGAIFEKPTVQGLAEIVRNRGGTLGAAVIPLHKGLGNVPLFFICGVHLYQTLARNLGAKQSSYGVWVPAEETFLQQAATSGQQFEEFAAEYVKTIRKHTPYGPYNLAGVSFGGLLAFEVARQLRMEGEAVPALVLLDSILPEALTRNPRAWFTEKLDRVRRLGLRRAIDDQLGRLFNKAYSAEAGGVDDRKKRDAELWRAINGPSCTRYLRANPTYDGPTMIVRALFRPELVGFDVAPELGWADKLQSTVSVVDVPGDHLGILTLSETADVMRSYLESLQPRERRSMIPSLVRDAAVEGRPQEPARSVEAARAVEAVRAQLPGRPL